MLASCVSHQLPSSLTSHDPSNLLGCSSTHFWGICVTQAGRGSLLSLAEATNSSMLDPQKANIDGNSPLARLAVACSYGSTINLCNYQYARHTFTDSIHTITQWYRSRRLYFSSLAFSWHQNSGHAGPTKSFRIHLCLCGPLVLQLTISEP